MSRPTSETTPTRAPGGVRDRTERFGDALVQHGPDSDRAYLLRPGPIAADDVALLERLAAVHGYTKLFAKTTGAATRTFEDAGFRAEARVPSGEPGEELSFCSRFLSAERSLERFPGEVRKALETGPRREGAPSALPTADARAITAQDADELAELYSDVFASYPFPIHDPAFLRSSMAAGTVFVGIRDEAGRLTAAASSELSESTRTCEMTDFATRPECRGSGLASVLLTRLEAAVAARGMRVAYTIARATSAGMNSVFARCGYTYSGTLVNNTHISGRIESMNVWFRRLD